MDLKLNKNETDSFNVSLITFFFFHLNEICSIIFLHVLIYCKRRTSKTYELAEDVCRMVCCFGEAILVCKVYMCKPPVSDDSV